MTKEEMIDWMMNKGLSTGHGESTKDLLDELEWQIVEREREACAKICETLELPEWPDKVRQPLAKAIRARGQE